MTYKPRPIDTAHVAFTPEILQLIERLAENAHDLWASKRLEEGWTLGPKKDGDLKQTPLLVPYAELPESEEEYARELALATLKAIIALGRGVRAHCADQVADESTLWSRPRDSSSNWISSAGTHTTRPSFQPATGLPARLCARSASSTACCTATSTASVSARNSLSSPSDSGWFMVTPMFRAEYDSTALCSE